MYLNVRRCLFSFLLLAVCRWRPGDWLSIIENNICVCFCRTSGELMWGFPSSATVGATGGSFCSGPRCHWQHYVLIFLFVHQVFILFSQIQNTANTSTCIGILVLLYLPLLLDTKLIHSVRQDMCIYIFPHCVSVSISKVLFFVARYGLISTSSETTLTTGLCCGITYKS